MRPPGSGSTIDWSTMPFADSNRGGTEVARTALEAILGEDAIVSAIWCVINGDPGYNVAESVLRYLRSPSAMRHCKHLIETSADENARRYAAIILKDIADERVLQWLPALLGEPSSHVQSWLFYTYQNLWHEGLVDLDELRGFVDAGLMHEGEGVRKAANSILEDLRENKVW